MTFRQALFRYVQNLSIADIPDFADKWFYTAAIGTEIEPYFIFRIITDPGQPVVFCDDQGENGNLLVQIDAVATGSIEADRLIEILYREWLKIGGEISIIEGITTHTYIIDYNKVEKPKPLSEDLDMGLQRWFFESELNWRKVL